MLSTHNEKEIQDLLLFTEKMIFDICFIREQTQLQDTNLYWTGIRMCNYRALFKDVDFENINQLRKSIEGLLYLQDEILNLAENIQFDIKKIVEMKKKVNCKYSEQQAGIIEQLKIISKKFNAIQNLFNKCNEEQKAFAKDVKRVDLILREKNPNRKVTKVKKFWNWLIRN